MQLLGWLAYPVVVPVPRLTLNCLAVWRLQRGQAAYEALPVPPPPWHLRPVWFAGTVLAVTAYVAGGFAVLAWEAGVVLLVRVGLPASASIAMVVATLRRYRASRASLVRPGRPEAW